MKRTKTIKLACFAVMAFGALLIQSCNEEDGGSSLSNEAALTGATEFTVIEKDTTITFNYEFVIPARAAGTATITATVEDLSHGVNYTTNPAEAEGVITVSFAEGDDSFSFGMSVIDDMDNLPNGNVTFTLTTIAGETATVAAASSVKITIIDNEGESITRESEEGFSFGEVVPGTESEAVEVMFTSLNIVEDFAAVATEGFVVGATVDGTFGGDVSIPATATSIFIKAAPLATASLGASMGTVILTSGEASLEIVVDAIISDAVGVLFWAEDFDYPVDDTYPSYGDNSEGWGIAPVSANLRLTGIYNGTGTTLTGQNGLNRVGSLDTWYTASRLAGIAMGDNPLTFAGYPGSGVGRTLKLGVDITNYVQRNDCKDEGLFLSKNSVLARRFVEEGQEIKTGNLFYSTMIRVNEIFPEDTPVLKNAIMMVTGGTAFVNAEAMKLNVRDDGSGGFNFGVSKSADDGSVVYGSTSYTIGNTYAVVVKVEIKEDLEGEVPNDELSVYVFEDGASIPSFEDGSIAPEAKLDMTNQGDAVHDVVDGLDLMFIREVADVWGARNAGDLGAGNVQVQGVEFSGIRVATSWNALFKDASEALHDNQTEDDVQTLKYGRPTCTAGAGPKLGNVDL